MPANFASERKLKQELSASGVGVNAEQSSKRTVNRPTDAPTGAMKPRLSSTMLKNAEPAINLRAQVQTFCRKLMPSS
jgi:hypothetical protein